MGESLRAEFDRIESRLNTLHARLRAEFASTDAGAPDRAEALVLEIEGEVARLDRVGRMMGRELALDRAGAELEALETEAARLRGEIGAELAFWQSPLGRLIGWIAG